MSAGVLLGRLHGSDEGSLAEGERRLRSAFEYGEGAPKSGALIMEHLGGED